jgi:CRP-like cAMP-binding protein
MHNFSAELPTEVLQAIDKNSSYRRIGADENIFVAGKVYNELYQICSGEAKYCSVDIQGRETVAAFGKEGDWIGLSEIFTGLPALSDVVAISRVKLRVIRKPDFDLLIDQYPVIARELLRLMSLRFSAMYYLNVDRTSLTLKERTVKTLYSLSFSHGKQNSKEEDILIELSQEELGKVLAVSRQNLNKILKELEREGLLSLSYGAIRLKGLKGILSQYGQLIDVKQPMPLYREH